MSHQKIHEDQVALRIMYLKSEKEKKSLSTKNSNLANYSSRMKAHVQTYHIKTYLEEVKARGICFQNTVAQPLWKTVWRFFKNLKIELP